MSENQPYGLLKEIERQVGGSKFHGYTWHVDPTRHYDPHQTGAFYQIIFVPGKLGDEYLQAFILEENLDISTPATVQNLLFSVEDKIKNNEGV